MVKQDSTLCENMPADVTMRERVMAVALEKEVMQAFVVLNPSAGREGSETVRDIITRTLPQEQWSCDFYEITGDEEYSEVHAIVRAAAERGVDMVIASGGDGTISTVANGLAHTETPMGIIPAGTANILARELNIPLDPEAACRLLTGEYTTTLLDAMQVDKTYYVLHVGVGIESLMIRDTEQQAKRRFGWLAYMWTALRWLVGYQPRRFTVRADNQKSRPRAAQVLIANGGTFGRPPFRWGPDITPDDGVVNVCIIWAGRFQDYVGMAWHMLTGRQRRSRKIRYLPAREWIAIDADKSLPVQGDGEIIGETPVKVRVVPRVVRVIVPVSHTTDGKQL
jgi:YegS/Rv2252/BmrU family lipid kinase